MEFLFGDLTTTEVVWFLVAVVLAAVAAGFLAGLFGIGGGAVMVPVFSELFARIGGPDTPYQSLAVATSLAVIVVTGVQSARTHYQAKNPDTGERVMDVATLKRYLIAVPFGAVIGLFVLGMINEATLVMVFAVVAGIIGLQTLFMRNAPSLTQGGPKSPIREIGGVFIGFISVLMGIGGGVLNNMFMTLQGTPLKGAIATSAAVGVLIAVPGAIGAMIVGWGAEGLPPLSIGYVNFLVFLVAIPITSTLSPIGARLTHSLPNTTIKTAFGVFLLITAARAAQKILAPGLLPF